MTVHELDGIEKGYRRLGAAICLKAFNDFCMYADWYKREVGDRFKCVNEMRKIEKFVKSEYYTTLTDIPAEKFLARLKKYWETGK